MRICTTIDKGGADTEDCDSLGQAPLHRTAISGFAEVVRLLLGHKVDIEARSHDFGRTPVHWAAWHGHPTVVSLLVASGAIVEVSEKQKWTASHLAASQGYEKILSFLLSEELDIDAKDGYGATALYRAAEGDHGYNKVATLLADFAEAARKVASHEAVKLEVGPQDLDAQNGTLRLNGLSPGNLSRDGTDGPEMKAIETPLQG
ncbi:MAG: hypothetical protein Q9221_003582 [Calogaya cf. arnoldii]